MRTLITALALLLVPFVLSTTALGGPKQAFLDAVEQDIASGNVLPGGDGPFPDLKDLGVAPPDTPPEGIMGYTKHSATEYADYTWVYARSQDMTPGGVEVTAWAHTTWRDPLKPHYYRHSVHLTNPIEHGPKYYISGFHWLPKNTPDYPWEEPGANPFWPGIPEWAIGYKLSPTYLTEDPYGHGPWQEPRMWLNVYLTGPSVIW